MSDQKPLTPNEIRDIARNLQTSMDRCDSKLREGTQYYNGVNALENKFNAQVNVLERVITSLIVMVFISMILNLGTVGILLWLYLKKG
jgi:hypothetical protein